MVCLRCSRDPGDCLSPVLVQSRSLRLSFSCAGAVAILATVFLLCWCSRDPGDCLSPVLVQSRSLRLSFSCAGAVSIPATVCLLCWCSRDPGDFLSPVLVWSLPLLLSKVFRSGMVSDGFQTQRRSSWIPGKERAERVLAGAISIDGKKSVCKFCWVSNVWTRWRCRRCCNDIPAGLRGKYRQAIAARTRGWSTGSSDVKRG